MKLEEKINQLDILNELGREMSVLMGQHRILAKKLLSAIKEKGVDIGNGWSALPDCCDSLFDETKDLTRQIGKKISLIFACCIMYDVEVPASVYLAKKAIDKFKTFFDNSSDNPPFAPQ